MSWKLRAVATLGAGVCVAMLVSGCDSVRQATGAEKAPPDEFTILSKSPLVIPPDFNLRPPPPGYASRNDPDADETGGNLALPSATAASLGAAYSDGEKLLLTKTNALSADPNIRKTITIDAGLEDQGANFAQKVLFQPVNPPKPMVGAASANTAVPAAGAAQATTAGASMAGAAPAPAVQPATASPTDPPAASAKVPAPAPTP